jgi:hypothetical protein
MEKKETLKKVEELLQKSSRLKDLNRNYGMIISNGGENYNIWYDTGSNKIRYGEARIDGNELVLYKDWYGNDHEILQIEVERIGIGDKP